MGAFVQAIILAGGFGTRLSSVISDVAKPMAQVNAKPFLEYIFDYLELFGIQQIVLCVGYKKESIQDYFKFQHKGIRIIYSIEDTPLGTGGAIKQALKQIDSESALVFNGDSFFKLALDEFVNEMKSKKIALALKPMNNFDRYGSVVLNSGKVNSFEEKKFVKSGLINAGVYLIRKDIFDGVAEKEFSFEKFLEQQDDVYGYVSDEYFIDIGIPQDYEKAQKDFKELF